MTVAVRQTRLAHFLEAYHPLDAAVERKIWDRIRRAGWSPEDPMSLQIAHETISEAGMIGFARKLDHLPGQLASATRSMLEQVEESRVTERTADRQVTADRVAEEVGRALEGAMPKLERQFHWRVAQRLVVTIVFMGLCGAMVGYAAGRQDTGVLDSQYASLAAQGDAGTWLRLQSANGNLDGIISKHCLEGQGGFIPTDMGRRACAVPLWLEGEGSPATGQLQDQALSLRARMPFGVILTLGVLAGLALSSLVQHLRHWR